MYKNKVHLEFDAKSINEGLARVVVAAFSSQLNPTLEEVNDMKTAVSEAVTNAIIHGYNGTEGTVYMDCALEGSVISVTIADKGVGIEDVEMAMKPLYTTKESEERSGMGFVFMEVFMDELKVESEKGAGTTVFMKKKISRKE